MTTYVTSMVVSRRVSLIWRVRNFVQYYWRGLWRYYLALTVARVTNIPIMVATLNLRVLHTDGTVTDYGIVSRRVVTTAGVNYLVDSLQGSVEPENFHFHGFGTGTNAEDVANTALQTELTTQYATDNTRPTGSQTEGASANIFRTVGTLDPDSAVAITEHGIFSQADNSGGTLLDRSVFSAVNIAALGDTLEATYELTLTAGS